jgi:hypothetical protein
MFESVSVRTKTRSGRVIEIKELSFASTLVIRRCIAAPMFNMPYLTGTPNPVAKPVIPILRGIDYVVKAKASFFLGSLVFGARRHWIMSIRDAASGAFLGVALLDSVVRFPSGEQNRQVSRTVLERHKTKPDELVGDAE